MELKYYHNKRTELISLFKSIGLAAICLFIIYLLNTFTTWLFTFMVVPFILGVPVIGSIFFFIRTILVINKPFLILNEHKIKYFNVLGYEQYSWSEVNYIKLDEHRKMIFLLTQNGNIFNRISIEGLKEESQNEILNYFTDRVKLITE